MNKKRFIDYQEQLLKQLQDEEFASDYLNEALNKEFYEKINLFSRNCHNYLKLAKQCRG